MERQARLSSGAAFTVTGDPEVHDCPGGACAVTEPLAQITAAEWAEAKRMIKDTHRAVTEVETQVKGALGALQSGKLSLGSMLFGGRK